MKLIVIGASGFIGSHVYSLSKKLGYDAVGTYASTYSSGLIKYDLQTDNIFEKIPEYFTDKKDRVVAIICSAISKIDFCQHQKELSYNINVKSTMNLVEKLSERNVKTVFLSTDCVFDGERGYYDESDKANPINEYGSQKLDVEQYVLSKIPEGLVLRLSKIVGDDPAQRHMFSEWYENILNNRPICCIEGLIFTPTYVQDVAKGVMLSIERNLKGLYHVANPEIFSRDELAMQFVHIAGKKAQIIVKPLDEFGFSFRYPLKIYMESSKFRRDTNMIFTSMKQVMKKFVYNFKG